MHSLSQLQCKYNNHTGSNPGHKEKPEFSDKVDYSESAAREILHLCVAYSVITHLCWKVASMTECRWMISCAKCKYQ
ncbi:unnamed protein product, partial [Bubo scandiacus]